MANKTIQSNGISTLSVSGMTDTLAHLYGHAILHGTPLAQLPSVMLWGKPGVGKSQGVRALAARLTRDTGKRVAITDVRLLLFNPIDLRGIPTADKDKQFAVWLRPRIFAMDPSPDVVNLLFLDEISAAPPSVQAAAYQITLDRQVGEHKLPDNCLVIAAGNRVSDKSVAYKMPKALANRLCHLEIEVDFPSWQRWAVGAGLDERVIGYLSNRRDVLCTFDPGNEDVAFATPRSWEMVSRILLDGSYSDPQQAFPLIAGCVGEGLANEFCSWCRTHAKLPDIDAICGGNFPPVPSATDALYATVRLMATAAGAGTNRAVLRNLVIYATRMPPDYTATFVRQLMVQGDDLKKALIEIPELTQWLRKHSHYFQS